MANQDGDAVEELVVWTRRESSENDDDDFTSQDGNSENIWDDSALIEAYDKAVSSFKDGGIEDDTVKHVPKRKKKYKPKLDNRRQMVARDNNQRDQCAKTKDWKMGEECLAMYYEDGLLYKATIVALSLRAGTCRVRFDYYENEAEVDLKDLFTTSDLEPIEGTEESEESERMEDRPHSNTQPPIEFLAGWRIGDSCLVPEKNGIYRQGIITSFPSTTTCEVTFVRHKENRIVDISDLHTMERGKGNSPHPIPQTFGMYPQAHAKSQFPGASEFPLPMVPPLSFAQNLSPFCQPIYGGHQPPPPPPPPFMSGEDVDEDALTSMLMSWYMVGYHTGFYQGLRSSNTSPRKPSDLEQTPTSSSMSLQQNSPANR